MPSLNRVQIIGRLGKDPEEKILQSGTTLVVFSVAVDRLWKSRNGESRKETDWFNVEAWGKLGENCATYLSKGKKVLVIGEMTVRPWVDKEGNNRFSGELTARDREFLSAKGESEDSKPTPKQDGGSVLDDLDTIPF